MVIILLALLKSAVKLCVISKQGVVFPLLSRIFIASAFNLKARSEKGEIYFVKKKDRVLVGEPLQQ